ncbi:EAL domain-containing protein [Sulfurospirillum sp. 1307]
MNFIRKNIWDIFNFIALLIVFIASIMTYIVWNTTYERQKAKQENMTALIANSTYSLLSQYEIILDMLGKDLLLDDNYKNTKKSKEKLKKLIKINPSIVGFGLVGLDGALMVTSINKPVNELPNLLKKKESKESFGLALKSNHMVVGRTYYHHTLKTYLIPIRKTIRDENGKAIAVMTAGIKTDRFLNVLNENSNIMLESDVIMFRESDNYRQLVLNESNFSDVYEFPVPKTMVEKLKNKLLAEYAISKENLMQSSEVYTLSYFSPTRNKKMILSTKYIKKYKLWIIVEIDYDVFISGFYKQFTLLVLFSVLLIGVLYILFRQMFYADLKRKKALNFQAKHDYLTSLKNRFYISSEFSSLEDKEPFALLSINIDNFKNVNANYGQEVGDLVLKEIGKRLHSFKDGHDEVIRYASDEFLFMKNSVNVTTIKKIANDIISKIQERYFMKDYNFSLSASIGIAFYPKDGMDFDEVKKHADFALYEAKKDKNSYRIFEDSIEEKYIRQAIIAKELKSCLANNEIYMVYQPQISKDGKLHGVEALVRWQNKTLGFIPPDEFISIAENTGFMPELGEYILKSSINEIKNLQHELQKEFQLSINVSVKQFSKKECQEKLFDYINEYGFNKSLLTLEVTESLFIEDLEQVLGILHKLKKDGIKVSLDDFGTGYSSLSLLKQLPIDELKIDKSFVDDILSDERARKMIQSIILIGKQLNMNVLAEGIEKKEQKDLLQEYGCDLYQGYYFAKPLVINDLKEFILTH